MSIILDTSFLIAINDSKDSNHKKANELKPRVRNKEFGQCYISDYIFDEFATFLKAKSFRNSFINEVGNALLSNEEIRILRVDENSFFQSWEMFKKMEKLSFTDCTTIILAKEFSIKKIASFDSDFDKVSYLERVQK